MSRFESYINGITLGTYETRYKLLDNERYPFMSLF